MQRHSKTTTHAIFIRLITAVFCLIFSTFIQAQDNPAVIQDSLKKVTSSADSTAPTPSHLELNLTWQSNDVNNGRKDSTVIPLITPKISYIFKSGFEIDLSVGYNTHETSPQVNQYTLDGSYSFNPGNYSGSVTLSGFIYNKQSGSTTSEQKGSLEYSNSYDFGFIEPSLALTWTFGNHIPDYQASPALQQQLISET